MKRKPEKKSIIRRFIDRLNQPMSEAQVEAMLESHKKCYRCGCRDTDCRHKPLPTGMGPR